MTHRGRISLGTLALVALAMVALPAAASARIAYFTGSTGFAEIAAPVELSTQTASPANQVTIAAASEGAPEDVAIAPDGKTAYVLDDQRVVPIDVATNKAGTAIPIPQFGQSIAISPDGRFAYVTSNFAAPDEVSKIDLSTGTVVATISVGHNLTGIAVTPDNHTVYVVSRTDNAVIPIDVATNAVGTPIPVGPFPSGIAITPDGTSVYVLIPGEEKLVRINVATNTVVATIPKVPGSELAISPSGAKAYVVGGTEVTPVDLATGNAGTSVPSSNQDSFEDVAFLPDGSRAYMTTQRLEMSSPIGLMRPIADVGNALQPTFPLNLATVRALAIVPNQPPHAAFGSSPAAATAGSGVAFDASGSTDSDGSVARYDWEFGDGTSAADAGPKPTHAFAKAGTYTVTLTTTDNEGCSTQLVFTGQTAYCNGSNVARTTHTVTVGAAAPKTCNRVKGNAGSFVPKRRPGQVVPGVRVVLSASAPARLAVSARIEWSRRHGGTGNVALGKASVTIQHWRRIRFAIPASLDDELPLGTAVTVTLKIKTTPIDASCSPTFTNRTLHLHVVKVFPDAVQAARPR